MNRTRLVFRSLFFFWRINLAVALGVVAATAVLVGALLVGDSMRGSLRRIALDGLGRIDEILLANRFFSQELVERLQKEPEFDEEFDLAEPVILYPNASASIEKGSGQLATANKVTLIGCRNAFWKFSSAEVQPVGPDGQRVEFDVLDSAATTVPVVLNETLAADLGIRSSDIQSGSKPILTVQIPRPQLINADNPIGRKEDLYETLARLEVRSIVPSRSLGRFHLHPSQLLPRILFVPLPAVQQALQQAARVNGLVVAGKNRGSNQGTTVEQSDKLNAVLQPTADDLGLIFKTVKQTWNQGGEKRTVFEYTSLSSDRLLLTDQQVAVARDAFANERIQPVLTYLANGLTLANPESETIPFSMVTAIDLDDDFQLQSAVTGGLIKPIPDNSIVINSWAARDFLRTAGKQLEPGSQAETDAFRSLLGSVIRLSYYEPESPHGKLLERTNEFVLWDIAKVVAPSRPFNRRRPAVFDSPPTMANDPDLTPFVPGVTDQNSINKWDLPFQTSVRPQDDDYWQYYRTTPKAFVRLSTGQRLWKSRFGEVTSIRIHTSRPPDELEKAFLQTARSNGVNFGFAFTPIKRRNLKAASGSTPFDVLFLALSFFIIAAALILISVLFRLGVDQKVTQLGLLAAVGLSRRQITGVLIREGAWVAVLGAIVGVGLGIGYAKFMVYGLRTWWVGAVQTGFMEFHWSWLSILIGVIVGVLVSLMTIWASVWRLRQLAVRDMLSGRTGNTGIVYRSGGRWQVLASVISAILAVILLVLAATSLGGEAQAGAFMGGGFFLLVAFLIQVRGRLSGGRPGAIVDSRFRLAIQNAGRNPMRSTLTIGLVAAATFLIVSVSSFYMKPTREGTGGFDFIAESSRPVVLDLQDREVRADLFGQDASRLAAVDIFSMRYLAGDEAGCNNPFQAQRPKVLGVPQALVHYFDSKENRPGFGWSGSTAQTESERDNPWTLLEKPTDDGSIPVVIDKNTAMYSLKIYAVGSTYTVEFEGGRKVVFRVVGFLSNSTLQGSLIIGEGNFVKLFPDVIGYRTFLIRGRNGQPVTPDQIGILESGLSDSGFDASDSAEVLKAFLAVQNTYLSTFQTLGALGLLLGTFGLATVQLRSVVERRRELAVMQAIGFSQQAIARLVLIEHVTLLTAGMAVGTLSAFAAVIPHVIFGEASVPIPTLLGTLLGVFLVGLVSGAVAVTSSVRSPILATLRRDD